MHFSTSFALLSSVAALSAAQTAPHGHAIYGTGARPYYPTGTGRVGAAYGTAAPSAGFGTGAGIVYTTNIVYAPVATPVIKPGANHFVNTTAVTLVPAPAVSEEPYGSTPSGLTRPIAFTGGAVSLSRPHGLTPYLTTIAGLALFSWIV